MRLVLCDENRLLGEALGDVLQAAGHKTVAVTASVTAGIDAVAALLPDACLVGLRFTGDEDGLAAVRGLRQCSPDTAVVLFTGGLDPGDVSEAKKLGAAGVLSKDLSVAQITDALDVIAEGGAVFDAGPANGARAVSPSCTRSRYELTPREREVLRRIVVGQSTRQMAREMNIATSTLRTYVKNLFCKLGTHSRLQAAAMASREGLLAELSA
jgi:two-component system, NarL family, nitrate/nitrite response regulator NarL